MTLNRPEKRNALTADVMARIAALLIEADNDVELRVTVLTGADPAFCAGFDLRNLQRELSATASLGSAHTEHPRGLMPPHTKPIVGAINGPAVTGGLELALGCDFLIASDRARFADTHGLVGVMPAGGMTIRLPELVGVDRARRMSLTGDFVDAATALTWGLVTEVVAHDSLVERALEVATSLAAVRPAVAAELRAMYDEIGQLRGDDAYRAEIDYNRRWMRSQFDAAGLNDRVGSIIERGSKQSTAN